MELEEESLGELEKFVEGILEGNTKWAIDFLPNKDFFHFHSISVYQGFGTNFEHICFMIL